LLMILGFLAVVYACAKIRVPIVSDWFRE
jgi:hypothetical protein